MVRPAPGRNSGCAACRNHSRWGRLFRQTAGGQRYRRALVGGYGHWPAVHRQDTRLYRSNELSFGNILLITRNDIFYVIGLDVLVLGVVGIFYNKFLAICFDDEFAGLRGIRTHWLYLVLLCLTALTIVLLVRIVGIVMVIALLTLPAAIAGTFAASIRQMMLLATLLCAIFILSGLAVSYRLDLPSGPVIIAIAAAVFLASVLLRKFLPLRRS